MQVFSSLHTQRAMFSQPSPHNSCHSYFRLPITFFFYFYYITSSKNGTLKEHPKGKIISFINQILLPIFMVNYIILLHTISVTQICNMYQCIICILSSLRLPLPIFILVWPICISIFAGQNVSLIHISKLILHQYVLTSQRYIAISKEYLLYDNDLIRLDLTWIDV